MRVGGAIIDGGGPSGLTCALAGARTMAGAGWNRLVARVGGGAAIGRGCRVPRTCDALTLGQAKARRNKKYNAAVRAARGAADDPIAFREAEKEKVVRRLRCCRA